MADKNTQRQYPIRVDISRQGAGRPAAPVPTAYRVGGVVSDAIRNAVVGNPLGVLGSAVMGRGPVGQVLSAAPIRNFAEGAFGFEPDALVAAPAPAAAPVTVKASTAAGAVPPANLQPIAITPQMRAMAEIDSILSQPHTRKEARETMALIPAPVKAATGKNRVAEIGAAAAQDWLAGQVAAAEKLKASDPDAARDSVAKAQAEYLRWLATLSGGNPAEQAMAGMYSPDGE